MMNEKKLDEYLTAYAAQTDVPPSAQLMDNILKVCHQPDPAQKLSRFNPWHWFDLMVPKAIGWALTCCLGLYLGLSSADQGNTVDDDEFYLYDQTQLMLSENFITEDTE